VSGPPLYDVGDSHHAMPSEDVDLSIVVPAFNEAGSVEPLLREIEAAVFAVGVSAEVIVVDDGSTDGTSARLAALGAERTWLRVVVHEGRMGQSAAFLSGIRASRGLFIGMLDADGQNDPADLVPMLMVARSGRAKLVQGVRVDRRDTPGRKLASLVGRLARRVLLSDPAADTGCSARVLHADLARALPLQFAGMHRFIPAYARMIGAEVEETPVRHRPRTAGATKYGSLERGVSGFFDCLAMRWMRKRLRDPRTRARS
jgi:dolichol-phosphate mannosyltransferase